MHLRHGVLAVRADFVGVATQTHHRLVTLLARAQRLNVCCTRLPDSVTCSLLFG